MMYEALRVFTLISVLPSLAGIVLFARYAYFYAIGQGSGHIQSVVVASVLLLLAFQILLLGLLADLIAKNRRLSEEIHNRMWNDRGGKRPGQGEELGCGIAQFNGDCSHAGRSGPPHDAIGTVVSQSSQDDLDGGIDHRDFCSTLDFSCASTRCPGGGGSSRCGTSPAWFGAPI